MCVCGGGGGGSGPAAPKRLSVEASRLTLIGKCPSYTTASIPPTEAEARPEKKVRDSSLI